MLTPVSKLNQKHIDFCKFTGFAYGDTGHFARVLNSTVDGYVTDPSCGLAFFSQKRVPFQV